LEADHAAPNTAENKRRYISAHAYPSKACTRKNLLLLRRLSVKDVRKTSSGLIYARLTVENCIIEIKAQFILSIP